MTTRKLGVRFMCVMNQLERSGSNARRKRVARERQALLESILRDQEHHIES